MTVILLLIPVALLLGGIGLVAFIWALKNDQFSDLEGHAHRIFIEKSPDEAN